MEQNAPFNHALRGGGRPQILLLGNGLERACGGDDWDRLLNGIDVRYTDGKGTLREECREARKRAAELPFPLLYELLATQPNPSARFCAAEITQEEQRLAKLMNELLTAKIDLDGKHDIFKGLPAIGTDHIFSTNYSYIPEKAFLPASSFASPATRSYYRFHLNPEKNKNGQPKREVQYRLHTGYRIETSERPVGIWHIHGECSVARGVVLGHDRYGRLLNRIVQCCGELDFERRIRNRTEYDFRSWPELFLFGDVYVLGFTFAECEFDLWWLLRRKQREGYGDGRVYFYDHNREDPTNTHQLLLDAHGVEFVRNKWSDGSKDPESFCAFYLDAMKDIQSRILTRRTE